MTRVVVVLIVTFVMGCAEKPAPKHVDHVSATMYKAPGTDRRLSVQWVDDTTIFVHTLVKGKRESSMQAFNLWSQFDPELIEFDGETIPATQYQFAVKDCGGMLKISLDSNYALHEPNEFCGEELLYIRDTSRF
jgi:hypothetical protein